MDSLLSKISKYDVPDEIVYLAVLNWVKHDENRQQYFASLFFAFDLSKFSDAFIEDQVADEPLVKENNDCLNAIVTRLINKSKEQRKKANAPKILSVGGENCNSIFEVYNIHCSKSNICFSHLPLRKISFHSMFVLDNIVYCVGGKDIGNLFEAANDEVFQINTTDQSPQ